MRWTSHYLELGDSGLLGFDVHCWWWWCCCWCFQKLSKLLTDAWAWFSPSFYSRIFWCTDLEKVARWNLVDISIFKNLVGKNEFLFFESSSENRIKKINLQLILDAWTFFEVKRLNCVQVWINLGTLGGVFSGPLRFLSPDYLESIQPGSQSSLCEVSAHGKEWIRTQIASANNRNDTAWFLGSEHRIE